MIVENMISVGHCVISIKKGTCTSLLRLFGWDYKPRSILASHAFDLVRIKRPWHSTEDGSEIVGVERVSVKNRYPACTE